MNSSGTEHFTRRTEKILTGNLQPYPGQTSACHPLDLPNDKARIQDGEDPLRWLEKIADITKYPEELILRDNVAFTAEIVWHSASGQSFIHKVHAQALILEGATVEEVIYGAAGEARHQYLRADFDPENLGHLFPDPMVHVHAASKGEPRFPLSVANTLPHVDFLELLLRNYAWEDWSRWADRVWDRRIRPTQGNAEDPRLPIRAAFGGNHHLTLREGLREHVVRWRDVLVKEKRAMCSLRYDPSFDEVLNY